ncbi:MAG: hypothetical protein ACKPFK_14375, partial [Dolichospermum sp.]
MTDYKKFILSESITTEQKAFFDKFGFIHFTDFINPHAVESLIKASREVQERWIRSSVEKING